MGKAFKAVRAAGSAPGHDGARPVLRDASNLNRWEKEKEGAAPKENVNVDRVRFLFHKGAINKGQYEGACALQRDWEMALILPQASSVLVGNGGSGGGPTLPSDARVGAMKRQMAAMDAVPPMCRRIVELVVIENMSVGKAASIVRAHHQFAAALLLVGLSAIARTYGFAH